MDRIEGLSQSQRSLLAELWISSAQELVGLLQLEDTARRIAGLLGLDEDGVRTLKKNTQRAMGPVCVEAAMRPRPLPPLGLPLKPWPDEEVQLKWRSPSARPPHFKRFFGRGPVSGKSLETRSPERVSLQNRLPPIRNQGMRGTCVAFAMVAAREYLLGSGNSLSEQCLYWMCKEMDGCPDIEGTWPGVAAAALEMAGVCEASLWPYNPQPIAGNVGQGPAPEEAQSQAWPYRIGGFFELEDETPPLPQVLMQILQGFDVEDRRFAPRPIVIGLPVYESWRSAETYRSGKIFRRIGDEPPIGGHAMLIVGYQLDSMVPGGGYFIVRNSWGEEWAPECPEGAGHALVSFQYVLDALDTMIVGTLLFSQEELDQQRPFSDEWMARQIEAARRQNFAALASEWAEMETLEERIEERSYRPDSSVEKERFIERTHRRITFGKRSVSLPQFSEYPETLRRPLLLGALAWQTETDLADLSAGRLVFAEFLDRQSQWLPVERWVRCLAIGDRQTLRGWETGKWQVQFPYKHLPVFECSLPPFPGIVETLRDRIGLQFALPDARFRLDDPRTISDESRPIVVSDWLAVPRAAQEQLGSDTWVGILDSGLDLEHPDFEGISDDNWADFSGEGRMSDELGHGTHCLGILAGAGKGDARYSGVAPRSRLLVARVFDRNGWTTLEKVLAALDWLAEREVNIVSLSLGTSESPNGRSQLTQVCDYLSEKRHMIFCVSAGNEGPAPETISPPADGRHVISVAALDSERHLADFSSRGSNQRNHACFEKPTLAGPGVRVVAARSARAGLPSFDRRGLYTEMSGTSMAAPAIAGVCSLLWSACRENEPAARRAAVLSALFKTAVAPVAPNGEPYSRECEVGHGVPDVAAALARLGWGAMPGKKDELIMTENAPAGTKCCWSGIPFAAGWKPGADYFRCENPNCRSPETERYISALAWNKEGAKNGGRRWCKNCLIAAGPSADAKHSEPAQSGLEGAARLQANVSRYLSPKTRIIIRGKDGSPRHYQVADLSGPVTLRLDARSRLSRDSESVGVVWMEARLVAKKAFFGKNKFVVIVGVAYGLSRAALQTALTDQWPDVWTEADLALVGVPDTNDDATPSSGQTGPCAWYVLPIPRKAEQWQAPAHWPVHLDDTFRRCFIFENDEERFKRYRELILTHARRVWDGTSDLRLYKDADLIELWQPATVEEVGRRFFEGHLAPVTNGEGALACIRLKEPALWLKEAAAPPKERARR
ncbi:MAG: S8 family serine peptidase [candidate division KSB1 bacterium]|nr:S8 family serine peptidase [candidate division KSB1 bacterium]